MKCSGYHKKIRKSVACVYASSSLSKTTKTIYKKLQKINWKNNFLQKESFIALWWRIPTVCLAYLCDDQNYINNNKTNNIASTGMDIAATIFYFDVYTQKTIFLMYYKIVNILNAHANLP